ncbi:DUF1376 domain-containing protein [Shinella sp.]|jgi:uncharacterized protein YdaU (DUF1376 family)|uniref:DUF1376 domain-containing protein n=1 Tax=Shinella sp. TaxID=1870904 RepID=UPI003F6FB976
MNGLPYYKAYPRDFIEGTIGMSFELKAAYRLVLDLIYMQAGELPDDARYISGLLGCTVRKWNSLRDELVSQGKVVVSGKFLTNKRAIIELETLGKLQDKQRENRRRPNKNKEIESPPFDHTEPDTEATLSSVASAPAQDDFDLLQSRLVSAAGEGGIQPHGALVVGPIAEMIAAGVSLELDVIPTIRAVTSRRTRPAASWAYFVPAIREAYERRVKISAELPKPREIKTGDDDWIRRLRFARAKRWWSTEELGPMPGQPGCRVPAHLLDAEDGRGWSDAPGRAAA